MEAKESHWVTGRVTRHWIERGWRVRSVQLEDAQGDVLGFANWRV
jgi:hypothetical protein